MKLLEKLKNTFFEEEYIEVEEEPPVVAKKVEPKERKKEVPKEEKKIVPIEEEKKEEKLEEKQITPIVEEKKEEPVIENYSDSNLMKKDNKVPYFEEEDFIETKVTSYPKEEPKKIYGESPDKLYHAYDYKVPSTGHPYGATQKEAFRPTPIISPIYGILDKNYRKEEVVDKKDIRPSSSYVSRKNADLDSVRRKAYGGIDPIEEMNKPTKIKVDEKEEIEQNLLYDMTTDNSKPVVDRVTIQDAEEYFNDLGLEYNVDYKDNRYEKAAGRRTSTPPKEAKKWEEEDANLEDNLFDLVDSYYEGGEE